MGAATRSLPRGLARGGQLGATVRAVVLDWDEAVHAEPAASLRRRLFAANAAGLDLVVTAADPAALRTAGLWARSPGRLWLCPNDARIDVHLDAVFAALAERGIGRGLVLAVGGRFDGLVGVIRQRGGLADLLDEQLARRRTRRVPAIDDDPEWIVRIGPASVLQRRIAETLCTLGAGGFGTRGAAEEPEPGALPMLLADGAYRDGSLLPGPSWIGLSVDPPPEADSRLLDMRTGLLLRVEHLAGAGLPMRTLRFASVRRNGVVALRAEAAVGRLRPGPALLPPNTGAVTQGEFAHLQWCRVSARPGAGIAAVAAQRAGRDGSVRTVERFAAYAAGARRSPALDAPSRAVRAASSAGFDTLLDEQRQDWAARWHVAGVVIPDDPDTQLAVRYSLFQLWSNVARHDECAVGARGLSGSGYGGHVFWDAEAFVLPAMASIDPQAARAMLHYRLRRLGAARARAAGEGRQGARFPWESAATGEDVTPHTAPLGGAAIAVRTGLLEEHITADVAWAAAYFSSWTTGRRPRRDLLPLLVETAQYWASRCRYAPDGSAHIYGVIGPDEYHEGVDDNAFTNVMARWNLRAGARAADEAGIDLDTGAWRHLADSLVDGYDPDTGRYEQFAGYYRLQPLLAGTVGVPPFAADLLLGHDKVEATQVIKQPDVLMLHHLVPGQVIPGSLEPNLDFYLPRTAHGSSLSPAVTATLLARAGRPDDALRMLGLARRLDLEDTSGMTAGGLHLANIAGVWQSVLTGFAGVSVRHGVLTVEPHLPSAWRGLQLRFRCLGRQVRLSVARDRIDVRTDGPLRVHLPGQDVHRIDEEGTT